MSQPIAHYIAIAALSSFEWHGQSEDDPFGSNDVFGTIFGGKTDFSGTEDQFREFLSKKVGFSVSQAIAKEILRLLAELSLVRVTEDTFATTFLKVRTTGFATFLATAKEELHEAEQQGVSSQEILNRASDWPKAAAFIRYPILENYDENGDEWLKLCLKGIHSRLDNGDELEDLGGDPIHDKMEIPGADRLVSLNHNQQQEIEKPLDELIEAVSSENAIDGDLTLLQVIKGQLKAGRELIKEGPFKLYTIQVTLIAALGTLVEKYKDHAIGAAAGQLLELLLVQLGLK